MEIRSQSNYVRITPRKARLIASSVRHLPLERVLLTLKKLPNRAARLIEKTIESGIANAEHNEKLSKERLFLKQLTVDEGPRFKRWRAAPRGVAHPYQKQTSHITVILDEIKGSSDEKVKKQKKQSTPKEEKEEVKTKTKKVDKSYKEKIANENKQQMQSQQYLKKTALTRKVIGK